MRAIVVNRNGHDTVVELSPEQIEAMTEEERQQEIARLSKWAAGEIKRGRLVVEVEAPGAEAVQVHKGDKPRLEVLQYESHSALAGG